MALAERSALHQVQQSSVVVDVSFISRFCGPSALHGYTPRPGMYLNVG
jgi:hypothetical protein